MVCYIMTPPQDYCCTGWDVMTYILVYLCDLYMYIVTGHRLSVERLATVDIFTFLLFAEQD